MGVSAQSACSAPATSAATASGRATALAFAARGSDIALLDLNPADLEETRKLVEAQGVRAYSHVTNVAQEAEVTAALDGVIAELGQLDVLVNNAGITRDAMLVKVKDGEVVGKMSIEQWNAVIGVNVPDTNVVKSVVSIPSSANVSVATDAIRTIR
jgi:3-oxoacyl-[acyl-carrier protein] reductase